MPPQCRARQQLAKIFFLWYISHCQRAVSSVWLERSVDIAEVIGSTPIPPTRSKTMVGKDQDEYSKSSAREIAPRLQARFADDSTKTTCEPNRLPPLAASSVQTPKDVRAQNWVEPREHSLVPMRTREFFILAGKFQIFQARCLCDS